MNELQTSMAALEECLYDHANGKYRGAASKAQRERVIAMFKEVMAQEPIGKLVINKHSDAGIGIEFSIQNPEEVLFVNQSIYAAPVAVQAVPAVTDEMVNRFLCWKLPRGFYPDGGITFSMKGRYEGFPLPDCWPIGTNLLTADQAREMLEHVIAAAPKGVV